MVPKIAKKQSILAKWVIFWNGTFQSLSQIRPDYEKKGSKRGSKIRFFQFWPGTLFPPLEISVHFRCSKSDFSVFLAVRAENVISKSIFQKKSKKKIWSKMAILAIFGHFWNFEKRAFLGVIFDHPKCQKYQPYRGSQWVYSKKGLSKMTQNRPHFLGPTRKPVPKPLPVNSSVSWW